MNPIIVGTVKLEVPFLKRLNPGDGVLAAISTKLFEETNLPFPTTSNF